MRELRIDIAPPLNKQDGDLTGKEISDALQLPLQSVRLFPFHVTPLIRFHGGMCHHYYRPEMFNDEIVAAIRLVLRIVRQHLKRTDIWVIEDLIACYRRNGEWLKCQRAEFRPGKFDVTLYPQNVTVRGSSKYFRLITSKDEVLDIRPYLVGMVENAN